MSFGLFRVPEPINEPVRSYAPGTPERDQLKAAYRKLAGETFDIPLWIGGRQIRTGNTAPLIVPHRRRQPIGVFHQAGTKDVNDAIAAAQAARPEWAALAWEDRAAIFLRAASLLRTDFRDRLNAATMLGQSKTCHQAEIDAACELIDFFLFNVHYLTQLYREQPISPPGTWNRSEYRPLDGFVFAVTPFNFTSIGGNLPTAPALCGNTVVWKPASTAVLSGHVIMELLTAAGLPPGVINFVPGSGAAVGKRGTCSVASRRAACASSSAVSAAAYTLAVCALSVAASWRCPSGTSRSGAMTSPVSSRTSAAATTSAVRPALPGG